MLKQSKELEAASSGFIASFDAVDGSTVGIAMCHGGFRNRQKGSRPHMTQAVRKQISGHFDARLIRVEPTGRSKVLR
jgi:hypothetical protein